MDYTTLPPMDFTTPHLVDHRTLSPIDYRTLHSENLTVADVHNALGSFDNLLHSQTSPISKRACKPPLPYCPRCGRDFGRRQELNRHMLSAHLPSWLHCPHSPCSWRGRRKEDFKSHLRKHRDSDPCDGPRQIYDPKIILDRIKDGTPVETAAQYAFGLVLNKAHELGFVQEWKSFDDSLHNIHGQTFPVSEPTCNLSHEHCLECKRRFSRPQELQRHILSAHLPCWLHCPRPRCPWRGQRKDEFRPHLTREHPDLGLTVGPCNIYDTKMILDWIKAGTPCETAASFALGLVLYKAHELGFVEEWKDLWGWGRMKIQRAIDRPN